MSEILEDLGPPKPLSDQWFRVSVCGRFQLAPHHSTHGEAEYPSHQAFDQIERVGLSGRRTMGEDLVGRGAWLAEVWGFTKQNPRRPGGRANCQLQHVAFNSIVGAVDLIVHMMSQLVRSRRDPSWRPTTLGGGLQSAFWQPFHKQPCFQHCARLFGAGSSIRGS